MFVVEVVEGGLRSFPTLYMLKLFPFINLKEQKFQLTEVVMGSLHFAQLSASVIPSPRKWSKIGSVKDSCKSPFGDETTLLDSD